MTALNELIDAQAVIACLAAEGLVRGGEPVTEAIFKSALANLRATVGVSAKGRGVTDPATVNFLRLGASVTFGIRLPT